MEILRDRRRIRVLETQLAPERTKYPDSSEGYFKRREISNGSEPLFPTNVVEGNVNQVAAGLRLATELDSIR